MKISVQIKAEYLLICNCVLSVIMVFHELVKFAMQYSGMEAEDQSARLRLLEKFSDLRT